MVIVLAGIIFLYVLTAIILLLVAFFGYKLRAVIDEKNSIVRGPYFFHDYWANIFDFGTANKNLLKRKLVDNKLYKENLDRPKKIKQWDLYWDYFFYHEKYKEEIEKMLHPKNLENMRLKTVKVNGEASLVNLKINGRDELIEENELPILVLDPSHNHVEIRGTYSTLSIITPILVSLLLSGMIFLVSSTTAFYWIINFFIVSAFAYLFSRENFSSLILSGFSVILSISLLSFLFEQHAFLPLTISLFRIISLIFLLLVVYTHFKAVSTIPATVYLYFNDPKSEFFPYEDDVTDFNLKKGNAPWWLDKNCRYYWVWRFIIRTPAELQKFWERDWERIELWVRAEGKGAGSVDWVVSDYHYREVWFDAHTLKLDKFTPNTKGFWILGAWFDYISHTPLPLHLFYSQRPNLYRYLETISYALKEAFRPRPEHKYDDYTEQIDGFHEDLFIDIPEHLRPSVEKKCIEIPWKFWRYARGVATSLQLKLYRSREYELETPAASDIQNQIKYKQNTNIN